MHHRRQGLGVPTSQLAKLLFVAMTAMWAVGPAHAVIIFDEGVDGDAGSVEDVNLVVGLNELIGSSTWDTTNNVLDLDGFRFDLLPGWRLVGADWTITNLSMPAGMSTTLSRTIVEFNVAGVYWRKQFTDGASPLVTVDLLPIDGPFASLFSLWGGSAIGTTGDASWDWTFSLTIEAVPEPGILVLLLTGVGAVGLRQDRSRGLKGFR